MSKSNNILKAAEVQLNSKAADCLYHLKADVFIGEWNLKVIFKKPFHFAYINSLFTVKKFIFTHRSFIRPGTEEKDYLVQFESDI